jgi:putative membrane protein
MMGNGFGLGLPGLGMILVWGAIILLLVWLVRAFSRTSDGKEKSARKILDERYARGEIDRQEYEQKKRDLT